MSISASLTLEPGFKSTVGMESSGVTSTTSYTIGETGALVGVPTSTLRYYERRGLVGADHRESGQRRYRPATVRRLVFVGMLQDAGLSLDDIDGILAAGDNAAWKEIANERLDVLDAEIERLQRSRDLLAAALLCRFDHPLDECRIMNDEIDRRLDGDSPR